MRERGSGLRSGNIRQGDIVCDNPKKSLLKYMDMNALENLEMKTVNYFDSRGQNHHAENKLDA